MSVVEIVHKAVRAEALEGRRPKLDDIIATERKKRIKHSSSLGATNIKRITEYYYDYFPEEETKWEIKKCRDPALGVGLFATAPIPDREKIDS